MKKLVIIILIIIAGIAVYFFSARKQSKIVSPATPTQEQAKTSADIHIKNFDSSDDLDQALQDLQTVDSGK